MYACILIIQAFSIDYYFLRVLKSYRSVHFHNHLFNHWIVDIFTPLMTPTKRCFSVKPLINIFFYMQHTSRTFYNNAGEVFQQDAGAWITPLDYLGIQPFSDIPMFKKALPAPQDGVYGGFPYYLPLRHLMRYVVLAHSMFICWSLVIQCMANSLEFHQRKVWNRIQAVRLC